MCELKALCRGQPIIVYLGRIWNLSSHPIQSDPASQKSKFKHDEGATACYAGQLAVYSRAAPSVPHLAAPRTLHHYYTTRAATLKPL